MSRLLSKTLIPHGRFFLRRLNQPAPTPSNLVCFARRPFSSKPQLIEIDLDSSASASSRAEAEAAIQKKLNEFVRRIIVQNSTPDWLPFSPGSSFWVPPHQKTADKIANLLDKVNNQLTEEESLSLTSPNGWPRSSFFISQEMVDHSSSNPEGDLKVPENQLLEVKLAHYPDPVYLFESESEDEEE